MPPFSIPQCIGLSLFLLLALFFTASQAITFEIEAKSNLCFFETLKNGTDIAFIYQVLKGGKLDIRVMLYSPSDELIFDELHSEEEEDGGIHEFAPQVTGVYQLCFDNQMSSWSTKAVQFDLYQTTKDDPLSEFAIGKEPPISNADVALMEEQLLKVKSEMIQLEKHIHYMRGRDTQHREIVTNTQFRLQVVTVLEALVLIGMSLGQILYIKRAFETRKQIPRA